MSDSVTTHLNAAVQKTYEWIKDVEDALDTDERHVAYQALRSVFHALRDRLTPDEAADLASELPTMLRGIFYECWKPANKPDKMSRDQFLVRVEETVPGPPGSCNPERYTRAVFEVLQRRITAGEISDVRGVLPKSFGDLWPDA